MIEVQVSTDVSAAVAGVERLKTSLTTLPAALAPVSSGLAKTSTALDNVSAIARGATANIAAIAPKIVNAAKSFDVASASAAALSRIFSTIDSSADAAKISLDRIGASRLPLSDIQAYQAQVLKLKSNLASVSILRLPPVFDPSHLRRLPPAFEEVNRSFGKLKVASNSANFALQNTGRVIQDLPFGFLGIANNLNPLLESFQRLKAESGSSKTALQQLGKSFLGAGGLGFALSIASTALLLFTNGFQSFSRKSREAKEDVDRLAEVLKSLGNIPDRKETIAAGTENEISIVTALSRAVLDQTKSYNERNNALNQLKDINKNYFGDLTLESDKLATLRTKVEEYTNAIIAAATVKAFSEDIGKLNVEFAKQLIVFNAVGNKLDDYKRQLSTTSKFYTSLTGEERAGSKQYVDLQNKISKTTKEYEKQVGVLGTLQGQMKDFKGALTDAVNESLKFDPLKDVTKEGTKSLDDFIDKTIARARQFASEFGNAFVVPDLADSFLKSKEQIFQASKKLLDDVSRLNLKVKVPVDIDFDFLPAIQGPPLARIGKDLEEAMRAISGIQLPPLVFDPTIILAQQDEAEFKKLVAQGKAMFSKLGPAFTDVFAEQFAKMVKDGMKRGLSSVKAIEGATIGIGIEALGISTMLESFDKLIDAIAEGKNAFASFGQFIQNTIKGVIISLLKAAAAAAVLSLITGGAGKGGLNFIGAFAKIFGGKGFAKGGIVPAGYPNDSYPALLSSHEVVLNPQQISSLMSSRSSSQPIVMGVDISGDVMRLIQKRSEKRAGRSYG